jgi:hypothetical protein
MGELEMKMKERKEKKRKEGGDIYALKYHTPDS